MNERLRQEAIRIEHQSNKEEGTLAAYLRGYAAGIIYAARQLQQEIDYKQMAVTLNTKIKGAKR